MSTQPIPDFVRGYNYAKRQCGRLADIISAAELRELAIVLAETTGKNAELARGIAAYFVELAGEEK
jgi:hypothetical protein